MACGRETLGMLFKASHSPMVPILPGALSCWTSWPSPRPARARAWSSSAPLGAAPSGSTARTSPRTTAGGAPVPYRVGSGGEQKGRQRGMGQRPRRRDGRGVWERQSCRHRRLQGLASWSRLFDAEKLATTPGSDLWLPLTALRFGGQDQLSASEHVVTPFTISSAEVWCARPRKAPSTAFAGQ